MKINGEKEVRQKWSTVTLLHSNHNQKDIKPLKYRKKCRKGKKYIKRRWKLEIYRQLDEFCLPSTCFNVSQRLNIPRIFLKGQMAQSLHLSRNLYACRVFMCLFCVESKRNFRGFCVLFGIWFRMRAWETLERNYKLRLRISNIFRSLDVSII